MNVARDVAERLLDLGLSAGGWTVRYSQHDPEAERSITVLATGGNPPADTHDGPGARFVAVQVRVRGGQHEYDETEAKAQDVRAALHLSRFGQYQHVAIQSEPLWLGYSQHKHVPEWSLNFTLFI